MNPRSLRGLAVGLVVLTVGLSGCAPSTTPGTDTPPASAGPTTPASMPPSTTPSATPTSTLAADQADAVSVAEEYEAILAKVRANPPKYGQYKMIDLLRPLAYDDMIQANLNGVQSWRDKGWHEVGTQVILSRGAEPASATNSATVRVRVTICKDQRDLVVVDRKGKKVTAGKVQPPDFLKNAYDMRRAKGAATFKVYEFGGDSVVGCDQ